MLDAPSTFTAFELSALVTYRGYPLGVRDVAVELHRLEQAGVVEHVRGRRYRLTHLGREFLAARDRSGHGRNGHSR
jgi:repressor of nif and glnA expression